MALFMVLLVIVGSTVVLENAATEARRAREDVMIWRGKQYIRAIKLYYRKTGHYPQDIDTLQKGIGNIHFLREAYPDPMNKNEDGKWRFIYTNASGAIIGSVRYATMQQMAILDLNGGILPGAQGDQNGQDSNVTPVPQPDQGNCPTPVGGPDQNALQPANGMPGSNPSNMNTANANQLAGSVGGAASQNQPAGGAQTGCPNPSQNQNQTGSQGGIGQPSSGLFGGNMSGSSVVGQFQPGQLNAGGASGPFGLTQQSLKALAQLKPTGPVDSPVIGGFLVGVGSTVDVKSQRVYKHGKKYNEWEFIWNPLEEQAMAIQQGINQAGAGQFGNSIGSQIGSTLNNAFGQQPGPTGSTSSTATPPQSQPQPQQ